MPRYRVTAQVTISLHADIEADSAAEAQVMADELEMPTIHQDYSQPDGEWATSGELDGEACNIGVEESE